MKTPFFSATTSRCRRLAIGILAATLAAAKAGDAGPPAENWPNWRGPAGGISAARDLPVWWTAKDGIAWRTELPGEGSSSPVIWGGEVFLTASTDAGKWRHVLALDRDSGRILWDSPVEATRVDKTNPKTGYAAPTPCTDGRRVYAFFDSPGAVATDLDGKVLWRRELGPFKAGHGMAASPALCDDRLIVVCDHTGEAFITALAGATGEPLWRTPRAPRQQFSSPLVIGVGGRQQIVVNGETVVAYWGDTGQEAWSCKQSMDATDPAVPTAVYAGGLVYVTCGRNGPTMAVDPTGTGDVTETHVRLHRPTGGPYVPSPLFYPHLLIPNDNGALRFLDHRGDVIWEDRLQDHFTGSPIGADDKIYWGSEGGEVYVLDIAALRTDRPGMRLLATNPMDEKILASPAVGGSRLYVRTVKALYCVTGTKKLAEVAGRQIDPAAKFPDIEAIYKRNMAGGADGEWWRLATMNAMAKCRDPAAPAFLLRAALSDPSWDVSEEAAKALGDCGPSAAGAVCQLLVAKDRFNRSYLKSTGAENAGKLAVRAAVPALVTLVAHDRPTVRIAAVRALAQIAGAHADARPEVLPAALAALADPLGIVQVEAIELVAAMGSDLGASQTAVAAQLGKLSASTNALVAKRATAVGKAIAGR